MNKSEKFWDRMASNYDREEKRDELKPGGVIISALPEKQVRKQMRLYNAILLTLK